MAHYRPPQPKSSPYITPEGFRALQDELNTIWKRRAEVTTALTAAAAEGDRSENAEYIYRKKELREIDRRIRYLQKRLPDLKVVHETPTDQRRVFFGAWVEVEDVAGISSLFRIVGADEIDPHRGWISIDSPMARALLKKTVDEDIEVETPHGKRMYSIIDVRYDAK
ncbi:MAG: transcription elongation factor GreB [Gammaproteobacteria bacterium]|nr:transcription elongation factor GreB [Gammaproteobacteria bacterium]